MNLFKLLGSCLLLLCLSFGVKAQQSPAEEKLLQGLTKQQATQAVVLTVDANTNNQVKIWQVGKSNELTTGQNGTGNVLRAIQFGSQNAYEMNIDGNYNSIQLLQAGNGNQVQNNLVDADNARQAIVQHGNDHELQIRNHAIDNKGLKVFQEGKVGMKVTIHQY